MSDGDWRASRRKRVEAAAIASVGYHLVAMLASTLRWRAEGLDRLEGVLGSGRQPIMAFWHGRIAGIIRRFGYGTARGSTSRGARRALRQLTRDMAAGRPAAFTLDGPRGPAGVAQPGAVWLAKVTGNPVLPFHIETDRHWTLRSWDRTQIPKPFATAAIVLGEPIEVPPDADEAGIELARLMLQERLGGLERRASALLRQMTK